MVALEYRYRSGAGDDIALIRPFQHKSHFLPAQQLTGRQVRLEIQRGGNYCAVRAQVPGAMSGYLGFGDGLDPPGIGRSSPANHKPFDLELVGLSAGGEVGDVGER